MKKLCKLILIPFCLIGSMAAYSSPKILGDSALYIVDKGTVTVTPARCPPKTCAPTTATLKGGFTAGIAGDEITFLEQNLATIPVIGFSLPTEPNVSSNGTTREVTFTLDGNLLTVKGKDDSRAFDGPLYEYSFTASIDSVAVFDAQGYYTARQDYRKCVSPMCGGIFVASVNDRKMQCPDGTRQAECYIGSVNWEKIGGAPFGYSNLRGDTAILLKGKVKTTRKPPYGNFGLFTAEAAYRPATNNLPRGQFFALETKNIFCITSPCFSTTEYILNSKVTRSISNFDLNPTGASTDDVDLAYSLYSEGQALIAVGYNKKQQELAGVGVSLIANQFYLPILITPECGKGYAPKGQYCVTPHGCKAPQWELSSIGGAALVDPLTGEVVVNTHYSCVDECDFSSQSTGPGRCSISLP